jgi:ATP-binding cassette subfamily F protein uup
LSGVNNYLSVEGISKSYGHAPLFTDLTYGIARGQKVALIGINGSGKSTLLKIFAGVEMPDKGEVVYRRGIRVGFLPQEPVFDESGTVLENVFKSGSEIIGLIRDYEYLLIHADESESSQNKLHEVMEKIDALDAWNYELKITQILSKLGIVDIDQQISSLSGGQRKRVAMAAVLIDEPDFIIMDEPTNHLDVEMIEWLEDYLATKDMTLLFVTHDRYFLDRVADEIIELDGGKIFSYKGDYAYFLEKKAEREMMDAAAQDKAKNTFRRELEWMRRQPKARTTKSKSRIDSFYEVSEKANKRKEEINIRLDIKNTRLGGKILEMKHVYKSFGDLKIVHNFTYTFKKGERIGIAGKNGSGKSTFLNMITGLVEPDSGKINVGDNTVYGYYSQMGLKLNDEMKVIDVVKEYAEVIELSDGSKVNASQFLQLFHFPPAKQYALVSRLSGGEKRRLHLLSVLIKNPNFLILDEPTNDLDLLTLGILEDFLLAFKGCLLIVSHDRYFMDNLVDHIFVFEGEGNIRDLNGNYSDFRRWKEAEDLRILQEGKKETSKVEVSVIEPPMSEKKRKLSFNEQREFANLEAEIQALENQKKDLTGKLNSTDASHDDLLKWSVEIEEVIAGIEMKSLRWLELSEFV